MSEGHAFGAVTVLNATATGRGCSLATQDGVRARWTWLDREDVQWRQRDVDDALAQSVLHVLRGAIEPPLSGADAGTTSAWPPGRGLKTSSAAAAALLRAGAAAAGKPLMDDAVARLAVEANLHAGTTITGAYDDQVATVRGGCHITRNSDKTVLVSLPTQAWHVAIWVPEARIDKADVKHIDAMPVKADIEDAERLARDGDIPAAMTRNGEAFLRLYQQAGLPVDSRPVEVALQAGALGAGLSGTGPAIAALFDDTTELPAVEGGTWQWTRVQEDTWT